MQISTRSSHTHRIKCSFTLKPGLCNRMRRLGRAADYSTALLQTRASTINAHGSSDYGFAESSMAVNDLREH